MLLYLKLSLIKPELRVSLSVQGGGPFPGPHYKRTGGQTRKVGRWAAECPRLLGIGDGLYLSALSRRSLLPFPVPIISLDIIIINCMYCMFSSNFAVP